MRPEIEWLLWIASIGLLFWIALYFSNKMKENISNIKSRTMEILLRKYRDGEITEKEFNEKRKKMSKI